MGQDLRLMFNMEMENYDRFRPRYVPEMFRDVMAYAGQPGRALEIGIGTGQATQPFLDADWNVTAVELGEGLAQFCEAKFGAYPKFGVMHCAFEDAPLGEGAFDLVYSATAFHWIAPEAGLPKVLQILRPGGAFAWITNYPAPSEAHVHIHEALQQVYRDYGEYFGNPPPLNLAERRRDVMAKGERSAELLRSYGFGDVKLRHYSGARRFNAQDYAALLHTYSDHRSLPDAARIPFMERMAGVIEERGGVIELEDTVTLVLGRKP